MAVRIQTEVLKQKLIQDLNDAWKETVSLTCMDAPTKTTHKPSRDIVAGSVRCDEDARQWELKLPKSDSASEQQSLKEVSSLLSNLYLVAGNLQRELGNCSVDARSVKDNLNIAQSRLVQYL